MPGSRTAVTRACITSATPCPNIDNALEEAQAKGATLKECAACKVKGSHVHPEGWVAFLEQEAGGVELELMQVYTAEELEQ